jgi:NAD(P)-dependent dehydrogenase (short-subunit alcohol dehydrogenase family)
MTAQTPDYSVPDYLKQLRLDGKNFVVLGAGQGIGEATTHALAQAGARVLCVDREEELAVRIAKAVNGVHFAADVTSRDNMQRAFDAAVRAFGEVHGVVDIIGMADLRPLVEFDDAAWARQFDVVVRHAFLAVQIGGELIAKAGGGTITFVGSVAGDRIIPRETAYASSKAALHHFVRGAGAEYAPRGVRVNAVSPGFVRTPRLNQMLGEEAWRAVGEAIPIGRAALPAEVAGPILFLASSLSAHMTGQIVVVDGGSTNLTPFPKVFGAPKKA